MAAFRYRSFRLFWFSQVAANIGTWMQFVATGWLVLQLTNSPAALGIAAALQGLPTIVFLLIGGVIADRFHRHRLVLTLSAIRLIPDATLALLVGSGRVQIWHIFAYALANGIMDGLNSPAQQSLMPSTLPRPVLMSALALNSVVYQGAAVVGPAIAGVVVATWGTAANFYINVLSDVIGLVLLMLMRVQVPALASRSLAWHGLVEGISYAWHRVNIRVLLFAVASVSIFARPYAALVPVFARDVFHAGPQGFGLMMTMPAIGTIAAGLCLAVVAGIPLARAFLVAATILSIILMAFANSPLFYASLPLLVLVGGGVTLSQALASTLMQQTADEYMRGRLMSLFAVCTIAAWKVAALPFGYVAQWVGAPWAVTSGAFILLMILIQVARSGALTATPKA